MTSSNRKYPNLDDAKGTYISPLVFGLLICHVEILRWKLRLSFLVDYV